MVPDGATLVIGGLMDSEVELQQDGVPWFGRLPMVGALFRDRRTSVTKKELVVLLTTRIWNPKSTLTVDPPDRGQPASPTPSVPPQPLPPLPMDSLPAPTPTAAR